MNVAEMFASEAHQCYVTGMGVGSKVAPVSLSQYTSMFAGDEDKLKTTFLFPHLHDNGGRPIYFTGYDYKARFILLEKKACYRYCRTCCTWEHEPEQEQQPATGWTYVMSSMEPEQEQQPSQED